MSSPWSSSSSSSSAPSPAASPPAPSSRPARPPATPDPEPSTAPQPDPGYSHHTRHASALRELGPQQSWLSLVRGTLRLPDRLSCNPPHEIARLIVGAGPSPDTGRIGDAGGKRRRAGSAETRTVPRGGAGLHRPACRYLFPVARTAARTDSTDLHTSDCEHPGATHYAYGADLVPLSGELIHGREAEVTDRIINRGRSRLRGVRVRRPRRPRRPRKADRHARPGAGEEPGSRRIRRGPAVTPATGTGIVLPPDLSSSELTAFARRADDLGFDALWVVEDCFLNGGIAQAATVLAITRRLTVGLGLLPADARNPAFAAMEVATLTRLRSLRVAGRAVDGVLLAEPVTPEYLATARERATSRGRLPLGVRGTAPRRVGGAARRRRHPAARRSAPRGTAPRLRHAGCSEPCRARSTRRAGLPGATAQSSAHIRVKPLPHGAGHSRHTGRGRQAAPPPRQTRTRALDTGKAEADPPSS
ncbi:LLM class flavin-dependent oxidoreductase [Streptomyces sp. BK79]|uniref:LLM class flavin-dependent oxidoreductase n=1 Tax=Streptomyces sp. BK79 TaxID=3350097 RepID=UPI00376FFC6C